jgi:hypothetical protein
MRGTLSKNPQKPTIDLVPNRKNWQVANPFSFFILQLSKQFFARASSKNLV